MFVEGANVGEALPACFTLIGFLSGVSSEVNRQDAVGHETLSADFTHVGFVASVQTQVNFQTLAVRKCLSADHTLKGFCACVRIFVTLHRLTSAEDFATVPALEAFGPLLLGLRGTV